MSLGLCLAGGGIKGAVHVGALKALEEADIKVDYIGGASSGSIVAALYASGLTPDEIYEIFKRYCKKNKICRYSKCTQINFRINYNRKNKN